MTSPDDYLRILDPDPRRAAEKYAELFRKLVKFFEWRRCPGAEDLAQETMTRGLVRIPQAKIYIEDATGYFWGIAHNLVLESRRQAATAARRNVALDADGPLAQSIPADAAHVSRLDNQIDLGQRLRALPKVERTLMVEYYSRDGEGRSELAAQMQLEPTAMRVRVHRIKRRLHAQERNEPPSAETNRLR